MPDALDEVLKSYGIPDKNIPAMRTAILEGTASISQEALAQAAQNAATDEMSRMSAMTEMANATKNRGIDPAWYEQLVASRGRAGIQREAEDIAKAAQHKQMYDLKNAVMDEERRLGNMEEYARDLSPRGGALTSNFAPPGEFSAMLPLEEGVRRTVGPAPIPGPITPPNELEAPGGGLISAEGYAARVGAERLRRAMMMRDALLGGK